MKPDLSQLKTLFLPEQSDPSLMEGTGFSLGGFRRELAGKPWDEITPDVYERQRDAFAEMNHESLLFYFPGFLLTAFEAPNESTESLMWFVGSNRFVTFSKLLSDKQLEFIFTCVEYLLEPDEFRKEYDAPKHEKRKAQILACRKNQ